MNDSQDRPSSISLPQGWRQVRLATVCGLAREAVDPQQHPDEVFAYYSIPAFDRGEGPLLESGRRILSTKTLFPHGAVLFSKLNPRIPRVWHAVRVHEERPICSTEFLPLVASEAVWPPFLCWMLRSPDLIGRLVSRVEAATKSRERLRAELLLAAEVPLPPLAEQRRIAAILSEQMAAVETARTAAEEQVALADLLKAAYLSAVFPESVPASWKTCPLEDAGDICGGVTLGRDLRGVPTRQVPYLRVANVKDGHLDLSDLRETAATDAEIDKLRLRAGDMLLTEGGDPDKLGRGTFWEGQVETCIHQNHIFRVRLPVSEYDPRFVAAEFGSAYGKSYFLRHAKQTTGIATINRRVLGLYPLVAPELPEQRRIADRLEEQMAELTKLRGAIEAQLVDIKALPAALLRRAFNGEL